MLECMMEMDITTITNYDMTTFTRWIFFRRPTRALLVEISNYESSAAMKQFNPWKGMITADLESGYIHNEANRNLLTTYFQ